MKCTLGRVAYAGLSGIVVLFLLPQVGSTGQQVDLAKAEQRISFEAIPLQSACARGSLLKIKLLVVNNDSKPLYLSRHLSLCGSSLGWVSLRLVDRNGQNVLTHGCSDDFAPFQDEKDAKLVAMVNDHNYWIILNQNEIFGQIVEVELPKKVGTYQIHAEIVPTAFTEVQQRNLTASGISILFKRHSAKVRSIEVK